ncbi:MAG: DUF3795 domain-containing protein [Ignavibacteria bacterium]|nr:DUF3795 domain-containing protein [Ignavibacteria bacterium]
MFHRHLNTDLIAACGMNCGICMAYLREKNVCKGCRVTSDSMAKHCGLCAIRNCELLKETDSFFCYDCEIYPCKRLKNLDKRYRAKYHMSMLDNLDYIKKFGLEKFVRKEQKRWKCSKCGGTINVHRSVCSKCGLQLAISN